MHPSPRSRPTIATGSPRLAPIPEPAVATLRKTGKSDEQPTNIKKSSVRVDAFLGEWLSPDYFELITPPPSSKMMVASAKADLLRREDYHNLIHARDMGASANAAQFFPGGWGSPITARENALDDTSFTLTGLTSSLTGRDRASSISSSGSRHSTIASKTPATSAGEYSIYQPPVPSYAISSSDPIPPGYVAHSRDACIDVDYAWDSMRDPQNWGNGGDYGEEWSHMHKRFRKGLQQLLHWYTVQDAPATPLDGLAGTPWAGPSEPGEVPEVEDVDLVVILVTHGAGCNALIGALTNQPVLLDVGMASLTMAVRKPQPSKSPNTHSRSNSRSRSISEDYEVKLLANTEHLRPSTSNTPSVSRKTSISGPSTFQPRFGANAAPSPMDTYAASRSISTSGLNGIRRAASNATPLNRKFNPALPRNNSIGLWSANRADADESDGDDDGEEAQHEEEEAADDMILNFGNDGAAEEANDQLPLVREASRESGFSQENEDVPPLGLWGAPRPPGEAERTREMAPKRRWTVSDKS